MKQRLSKVEASQELGVSISTIDRMIRRGDLQIEREGTKSNDRVWVILEGEEAAEAGDGASASASGPAAGPSENGRRFDRKGGRVVRWAHRGPGLLGCWTVALPQEVPPAGVSFRSESLSMPEKG